MTSSVCKVIKVGGKFFDLLAQADPAALGFFDYLSALQSSHSSFVLVHGGGNQVSELLDRLGHESRRIDGLRVTSDHDIPIVSAVLAGNINKHFVSQCISRGINAVGLSLCDGQLAQCKAMSPELGWVGEPTLGDARLLKQLLQADFLPIVSSIGCDAQGNLYNVNADHAAQHVAKLLKAELILLSDVIGVLDAKGHLLDSLDAQAIQQLIDDGVITDGMAVKVRSAQQVADQLNRPVSIASWANAKQSISQLSHFGTRILPSTSA